MNRCRLNWRRIEPARRSRRVLDSGCLAPIAHHHVHRRPGTRCIEHPGLNRASAGLRMEAASRRRRRGRYLANPVARWQGSGVRTLPAPPPIHILYQVDLLFSRSWTAIAAGQAKEKGASAKSLSTGAGKQRDMSDPSPVVACIRPRSASVCIRNYRPQSCHIF